MHPHRFVRCRWPVLSALAVMTLCSQRRTRRPRPRRRRPHRQPGADGVAACVTCHGAKGEGNPAAGFPHLAGLGSGYLYEQLTALANGSRANPVMAPVAKGLSDAQRQALAEYYAGLSAPSMPTDWPPPTWASPPRPIPAPGWRCAAPGTGTYPPATSATDPAASG